MATERKPFVRLETSLLREPWKRDVKATLVLLMCFLGDRWARDRLTADQACRAVLTPDQMHAITGRAQLVHARRALRALGAHVTLAIREQNELTEIRWPKFAETQDLISRGRELKTRRRPESAPDPAPAPAQARKKPQETPKRAPAALALIGADDALTVDADRLVALLAAEPGERADKVAWLERELPLMVCEVMALPGIATREQAMAKLKALIFRWWRQEQRNPGNARRVVESFDERKQREAKAWLASL